MGHARAVRRNVAVLAASDGIPDMAERVQHSDLRRLAPIREPRALPEVPQRLWTNEERSASGSASVPETLALSG